MLSNKLQEIGRKALTLTLIQPIALRYQKRRSIFDKTAFNQNWIPRPNPYPKTRKPPQPGWTDPTKIYPQQIPPLYKPCTYRHYMRTVIEAEQRQRLLRSKEYRMTDIRSGDLVDITYQQTFENEQTVTYRCYVIGVKRFNNLTSALEVLIRLGGIPIKSIYLTLGPRIRNIKLVSRGSGVFKANFKFVWRQLTKKQMTQARIKKGVMKSRGKGDRKRKVVKKNKPLVPDMTLDKVDSDNVRRILRMR